MKASIYSLPKIVIALCIALPLFSIDMPKEPTSPNVSEIEDKSEKDARGEKKKKSKEIRLKLCDNREIKGQWDFDKEELSFTHTIDKIHYSKKIKFSEITAIRILSWEAKSIKKKSDGKLYKMLPKKTEIVTINGKYLKDGLLEFQKFTIQNENGSADLFVYWMDVLSDNGKWYSNLPLLSGNERKECHPDVIKEIFF